MLTTPEIFLQAVERQTNYLAQVIAARQPVGKQRETAEAIYSLLLSPAAIEACENIGPFTDRCLPFIKLVTALVALKCENESDILKVLSSFAPILIWMGAHMEHDIIAGESDILRQVRKLLDADDKNEEQTVED